MGKKRSHSEDTIRNKIRKLEKKLKRRRYERSNSSSSELSNKENNVNIENKQLNQTMLDHMGMGAVDDHNEMDSAYNPSDMEQVMVENSETAGEEPLDTSILAALGEEGGKIELKGEHLKQEIIVRWENIFKSGLQKEVRTEIFSKYPTPANFLSLEAPKLNAEIVAAISEVGLKRDKRTECRQNIIGTALASLGKALTMLLSNKIDKLKLIEAINDASKLLCEVHCEDSESRRFMILSGLNKNIKEAVDKVPVDKWLFGEELGDRLKTAKAVAKAALDIKIPLRIVNRTPQQTTFNRLTPRSTSKKPAPVQHLNWRGPPRQQLKANRQGGQKHQTKKSQVKFQQKPETKYPPRRY